MNAKIMTGLSLALVIGGCASIPQPNAALESAKVAVQAAESDPNVSKYAALDLDAAKKQLAVAEAAAMHHEDAAIAQPAYLAAQTARLAKARATAKADDARVAAGKAERDKIQLDARTRDVAKANMATDAAVGQRDQATEKAARLQAEVDQLKATPTPRGLVLTLGDVLFDTGKAQLNPGSARKLDQLAKFLNDQPERRVQIDGFTDSVGTDSYNQDLSQLRADAVKSALIVRGVNPSRIGSQGYGKGFPVANNSDSGGRQLNRRVEVVIGEDNGASIAARG
ncbi:MAG TPA: OmpA family protein [Candidatus Eremiobacteraceae bacterium]|jgi:outer membrane protein OmpA-like peptidoglycan-associated protein|nr:OmpA family protein [Candidatus Eremiobacteraceae bacterium]